MLERVHEFMPYAQIALDAALVAVVAYFLLRDRESARRLRADVERLQELAASLRRLREEGEAAAGEIAEAVETQGAELRRLLKESEKKRGDLLGLFEAVEERRMAGVIAPKAAAPGAASADLYMRAAKLLLGGESEADVADAMGLGERELRLIRELQSRAALEPKPSV